MRERGAQSLVGTPKTQLRRFEKALLDTAAWHPVREGLEVNVVPAPEGGMAERSVLFRRVDRAAKERAMLHRQMDRLRMPLSSLDEH